MPNVPEPVKMPDGTIKRLSAGMTRIISYGDTPKEAVDGHFEIMEVGRFLREASQGTTI